MGYGKYLPLYNHFKESTNDIEKLSFEDIENIIKCQLPDYAKKGNIATFWNNGYSRNHVKSWLDASWEFNEINLNEINLKESIIVFVKKNNTMSPNLVKSKKTKRNNTAKMSNNNVKILDFTEFYKDLESAKNIEEIKKLFNKFKLKRMDREKYPCIEFDISKEEIETLKNKGKITNDNKLNSMLAKNGNLTTTLEKLLYSIIWKNGHLGKESHIISGILGINGDDEKKGIVFNQLGRHLNNKNEMIIDQHVMRAYIFYRTEVIKKKIDHNDYNKYLDAYKVWIKGNTLFNKNKPLIDELLFSIGKKLKK